MSNKYLSEGSYLCVAFRYVNWGPTKSSVAGDFCVSRISTTGHMHAELKS